MNTIYRIFEFSFCIFISHLAYSHLFMYIKINTYCQRLLILIFLFIGTFGYAQEDCINGIDDDGNGLVDSQDPGCFNCYSFSYELIEEDFEAYTCCPEMISQWNCIDSDWEAGAGTVDYYNTCDFLGDGSFIPLVPLPIPNGEGALGFGSWNETYGICLDFTLLAGETYDISFYAGFNSSPLVQSDLNLEISLFGGNDCALLDPFIPVPCENPGWSEIATFNVNGVQNDSWILYSGSFTPAINVTTIALGHSCNFINNTGSFHYHFIDDIQISGNAGTLLSEPPEIFVNGDCVSGVFLETSAPNILTYQWYLEGEIIPGATSNPQQIDATQPGSYQLYAVDNINCGLYSEPILVDIELDVLEVDGIVTDVSCATGSDGMIELLVDSPNLPYSVMWSNGASGVVNDNLSVGTYNVTITDSNGCFSVESYEIIPPEKVNATVSGDCVNGVSVSIEHIPGAFYQWYLDGIIVAGAIGNPYEVPSDFPGEYHVIASNGTVCIESIPIYVDITLNVLDVSGEVTDLLCYGISTGSINATADDMNPPLSYHWSNGNETQEITNLESGFYTVTVIDDNGCYGEMEFFVDTPTPFINTLTVVQPDMGTPGSAEIVSNGGQTPYSYAWSNGFDGSSNDNLSPGSYSITVTDGNGCIEIFEFEIESDFTVSQFVTNESCPGACDGSILLFIEGGLEDYTITWSDSLISGFNPTELCSGLYVYVINNNENDSYLGTITIASPPEIVLSAVYEDTICANVLVDTLVLEVGGGTAPFTYLWNTESTQDTLFDLSAGTYTVEVTDSLGCTKVDSFVIDSLSPIEASFITTPTGCDGDAIGTIDMTIENGISPFDILWSNDSITEDLSGLGNGWYSVMVIDSLGCVYEDSVEVVSTTELEVMAALSHVNCVGEDDGSIVLEISGGTSPYSILWSNTAETATIENLSPGAYEVLIIDAEGCEYVQSYEIILNSDIIIDSEVTDNDCFGTAEGSIELEITNVNTSFSVQWEDGSTDEDRLNLLAGNYSYTLVDSFGCEYMDSFTISEGVEITYQTVISEPECNGATNGLISISPVTGAFPLSYQWSTGDTDNQIDNLMADTYFLTVTDNNGCVRLDTFLLSENGDVVVVESIEDNPCYGDSEGSIQLDISGGVEPYDILWSNGETTSGIDGLPSGDYSVMIEDFNGCTSNYNFTIFEPDSLRIEDIVEMPLCFDDVGSIVALGFGGTPMYSFLWSTGATSIFIDALPGETYSVTLTDRNLCTTSKTFVIEDVTEIFVTPISVIDPGAANNDGSIAIDVSGGTGPYTITWDNGGSGLMIDNLGVGTYTANVVDSNGCTQSITIELSNEPLSIIGNSLDNLCFGDCEGEISLDIIGGLEPYTINWSNGQVGTNIIEICNGEYQATITDGSGVQLQTEVFTINSPDPINVLSQINNPSCVETNDGAISINSNGGVLPHTYSWGNTLTGNAIEDLSPGEYFVTIEDENGCTVFDSYTIDDIPAIDIEIEPLAIDCDNPLGGFKIIGENPYDYAYLLNGNEIVPNAQDDILNLEPGPYQLSYSINPICTIDIVTFEIEAIQEYNFELSDIELEVIEGDEVLISLNLNGENLTTDFVVEWNVVNSILCTEMNEFDHCLEIELLAEVSEVVQVVITDKDGCETVLELVVNVSSKGTNIYIPNIFSPNGDGINDEFTIESNDRSIVIKSFDIYDRWGNVMFTQRDVALQDFVSWDGWFNGSRVAPNVYVYVLDVVDGSGESKVIYGDLAVVY